MRRRGISPVIATVILVAVAIAVAIAVAFWMTGMVGLFTGRVEQLEVVSATAKYETDGETGGYYIYVVIRNSGTSPVTIDGIFITPEDAAQGASVDVIEPEYLTVSSPPEINSVNTGSDLKIEPGGSVKIKIGPISGNAGQSIEVKIHSAGGKEYPKMVVLP